MLEFTLRRLLGTVPVIFGILAIAFIVLYLVPGDPAQTLAGPRASPEARSTASASSWDSGVATCARGGAVWNLKPRH